MGRRAFLGLRTPRVVFGDSGGFGDRVLLQQISEQLGLIQGLGLRLALQCAGPANLHVHAGDF